MFGFFINIRKILSKSMAHFAELDSNNIVKRVIVVSNNRNINAEGNEDESVGIAFCRSLYGENTNWKQTSYNHSIRKCYAGIGMVYNEELDMFVGQQPYSSWTLDSDGDWNPPIAMPELTEGQNGYYEWNESAYQADNTTGWDFVDATPEPEEESPSE